MRSCAGAVFSLCSDRSRSATRNWDQKTGRRGVACAVLPSFPPHSTTTKKQPPHVQMTSTCTGIQVPPSSSRVIFAKDHCPYVHAAHLIITSAVSTSPYPHTSVSLSTSAPTKRKRNVARLVCGCVTGSITCKKAQAKKVLPGTRSNWPLREAGRCRGTQLSLHYSCII